MYCLHWFDSVCGGPLMNNATHKIRIKKSISKWHFVVSILYPAKVVDIP